MKLILISKDFKGHKGIPGHVGGSLPKGASAPTPVDDVTRLKRDRVNSGKSAWIQGYRSGLKKGLSDEEARKRGDAFRQNQYDNWDYSYGEELKAAIQAKKNSAAHPKKAVEGNYVDYNERGLSDRDIQVEIRQGQWRDDHYAAIDKTNAILHETDKFGGNLAQNAIDAWTHGHNSETADTSYPIIGDILRGNGLKSITYNKAAPIEVKHIDHLTKLLDNASTHEDVITYRGINDQKVTDALSSLTKGQSFVDPSFVSTSFLKSVGTDWSGGSGIRLKIKVPKGSKALFAAHSNIDEEVELLLQRNAKFILTKDPVKRPHGGYDIEVMLDQSAALPSIPKPILGTN